MARGWFNSSAATGTKTILRAAKPSNNTLGGWIYLNASGELRWLDRFPAGNSGGTVVASAGGYNDGGWRHFVAVKDGTEMTLIWMKFTLTKSASCWPCGL